MKKWFVVLCFCVVGTTVFAQTDPHARSHQGKQTFLEDAFSTQLEDAFSNKEDARVKEILDAHAAFERELARAKAKAPQLSVSVEAAVKRQEAKAMRDPHWPQGGAAHDVQPAATSDRPSYYMGDDAWFACKEVEICATWAREQAGKDMHFIVLSAQFLTKEDQHNRRLEVRYSVNFENKIKSFEEDFNNGWKEIE